MSFNIQRAELTAHWVSIAAFAFYGPDCIFSDKMRAEFARYGLARFRVLTGVLQCAGAAGLFAGFYFAPLVPLASAGLAVMMLLGVAVRLRIRDPLPQAVPALVLSCLNAFVCAGALSR